MCSGVAGDSDEVLGGIGERGPCLGFCQGAAGDPVFEPARGAQQRGVPVLHSGGSDGGGLSVHHGSQICGGSSRGNWAAAGGIGRLWGWLRGQGGEQPSGKRGDRIAAHHAVGALGADGAGTQDVAAVAAGVHAPSQAAARAALGVAQLDRRG
ncbi:hypothetical protein GCM10010464_54800 [Pseudonocardia yunnanensis]